MIKEDFVSFEVAKLLKEKGFDEECRQYWSESDGRFIHSESVYPIRNITNPCFFGPAAPTLQMAAKWLREEHNLSIDNTCSINGFYCSVVHIVKDKGGRIIDVEDSADWETPYCKTFEEAFDKALKFCLERMLD